MEDHLTPSPQSVDDTAADSPPEISLDLMQSILAAPESLIREASSASAAVVRAKIAQAADDSHQ